MTCRTAIIIGAGPAGLTAAYELLKRSEIKPLVLEASPLLGGLSRTEVYKGNRIDIGGHRFFSKSDRVMQWWLNMLPLAEPLPDETSVHYRGQSHRLTHNGCTSGIDTTACDDVMLLRKRKSRIYFLRKFFDYPLAANLQTVANLGYRRTAAAAASYAWSQLFPTRPELTLEDYLINRFGHRLYSMFFQTYTEKVWGVPCRKISAEWGAQRIKGLSITSVLLHTLRRTRSKDGIAQKEVATSLIEQFLYPKLGPGQMWERCGALVRKMGGEIRLQHTVSGIEREADRIVSVTTRDDLGKVEVHRGDYFLSTMPVRDLIARMTPSAPPAVRTVAEELVYRDFITVGLLVQKTSTAAANVTARLEDNWIYIQDPEVKLGRLQIFNNWSPAMVAAPDAIWLGLEYFCSVGDSIWSLPDADLVRLGIDELAKIGLVQESDVIDGTAIRTRDAYPAYIGAYDRFDTVRSFVDNIENLYLIGRNGMHRYNNQDHSMLTAMTAVDNICTGRTTKHNIWEINTEEDYHEDRS
jgi:protoporphyrinogen oxidase